MLITRWLRIRSQACRVVSASENHARKQFHAATALHRNPSRQSIVPPLYIDTVPPTREQLHASEIFFKTYLPTKSWTATEWRQQPHSESTYLVPEVAFLGRSNSGKSSLLNGLLFDQKLCRVGAKPGKTITMHAWSLSPYNPETRGVRKGHHGDMEPKLTVLDMPGYGHGSHGDWGADIMKYLTARRQLRRAFVLVNPVHGLKEQDLQMLELLRGNGIPHQMIACKADGMKSHEVPTLLSALQTKIDTYFSRKRQAAQLMTIKDILTIGGLAQTKEHSKWLEHAQGLHDVRWAILRAAGLEDYAMMLAANGGILPKVKRGSPTQDSGKISENPSSLQQSGLHPSIQLENPHEPVNSSQKYVASHGNPTVDINAQDPSSETFNPIHCHSNQTESDAANNYTRFENDDELQTSPVATSERSNHSRSYSPRTTRLAPSQRRARNGPSSNMKGSKRAAAKGR